MNKDVASINNYAAPIYTVDENSPDYDKVWDLYCQLGWVAEGRRRNFLQGRFNAFCTFIHAVNETSDYVFSTDLSKASHTVRGWPISYECVSQTIRRLEELSWIVRHKPQVENHDYIFDLSGTEQPTKRPSGQADRFFVPKLSPLRLGYKVSVVQVLDKQGRPHIGGSIQLYAKSNKDSGRGSLLVEELYVGWKHTKAEFKIPVDRINHLISQHDYRHPEYPTLNKWGELQYRRQFIRSLRRYGRLHSKFQNESCREKLKIDGKSVAEVDVHASSLQLLAGHPETTFVLPNTNDFYQAGQLSALNRGIVKTLVQVILNSKQPLLERKYWPKSIREDDEKYSIVKKMPWSTYRDALAATYPMLTTLPEDFGMRLFRIESDIIVIAMLKLLEAGIGCLSVHDCLIVPLDRVDEAKKAFSDAYEAMKYNAPLVTVEYALKS